MGKRSYSAPLARLKKDAHKQEGEYGKGETFLMNTGRIQVGEKHPSDLWECFWGVRTSCR